MGDISDYMIDKAINQCLNQENILIDWNSLLESRTWLTANRVRVPINEMSTPHIKNTLRCLKGESHNKIPHGWNNKSHDRWIQLFESELNKRLDCQE